MHSIIKLGGRDFFIPAVSLQRSASVLDGPNAGRLSDGGMQRDIIGTFYNYQASFDMTNLSEKEYDEFYEIITAPVDSHAIVLPYGQTDIQFQAYISNANDELLKYVGSTSRWGKLNVTFTAMKPQRA